MSRLFLLPSAQRRDPRVEEWFAARDTALGHLALDWFTRLRSCGEDVRELLHDGCPVACVGVAAFAYVNVFSRHVNLGFYQGALLPDPAGLLLGNGHYMRHAKLLPGTPANAPELNALVLAAYADIRARLAG